MGGLNTYSYVYGNPTNYIDPFGLNPGIGVTTAEGAAIGGTFGGPPGAIIGGAIGFGVGVWGTYEFWNWYNNEDGNDSEAKPESCPTPNTDKDDFENVRKSKAKKNKKTGEIWEPDLLHKDHWEVYKDKKNWGKGRRSKSVWNDGRIKQYF